MTTGLTVSLYRASQPQPPPGWADFVVAQRLPAMWAWPLVNVVARVHHAAVLAATVADGQRVRGLITARFIGPRGRRGTTPVAGIVDVDCLLSASMPGLIYEEGQDPSAHGEALAALRIALRHRYGRRVAAVMLRQVSAETLPAILRWPAIVREGGPIAVFRNTFTDFDGYLGSLSSSRRKSLRRLVRQLETDPDLTIASTARGEVVTPPLRVSDIQAQHGRTVDRHHRRWWLRKRIVAAEVARAQLDHPGVDWLAYHNRAGTLLGFGTMWNHPELPYAGLGGGLDLAAGGRKDLWFHRNMRYVRWCIESGRSGFVSGQGTIDAKLSLGYELRRQWAVLVPQ